MKHSTFLSQNLCYFHFFPFSFLFRGQLWLRKSWGFIEATAYNYQLSWSKLDHDVCFSNYQVLQKGRCYKLILVCTWYWNTCFSHNSHDLLSWNLFMPTLCTHIGINFLIFTWCFMVLILSLATLEMIHFHIQFCNFIAFGIFFPVT